MGRDLSGRPENPGTDRVSDDYSQTEGQTENPEEIATCRTQHVNSLKD